MILEILIDRGKKLLPSSPEESSDMAKEALGRSVGGEVWFSFVEPGTEYPGGYLRATIDETGCYGALLWYNTTQTGGVYDHYWLSDNPKPLGAEPELLADRHTGALYDSSSILPMAQIAAAVHEFCLDGTGKRPGAIGWATGAANGQRDDNGRGGLPGSH